MTELSIAAEKLGKQYRIGEHGSYRSLRESIMKTLPGRQESGVQEAFWAVRDISFDLREGSVLGIIGRNGAGKSTLLKLLSRITRPTEGRARIRGRVAALLEVGTGFHPELTGRENIALNGAILGMRRNEIRSKLDEIVEFAEVERFIDTPVKRYSSGMRMRLAFSVAAHLQADVLFIDEVLAVGDAEFQKKCLGKIEDATAAGRTAIFVSHNMAAIGSLCERVIWLDEGRCVADGAPADIISRYLTASFSALSERDWPDASSAPGNEQIRLRRCAIRPTSCDADRPVDVRTPFELEFLYFNLKPGARLNLSLHIYNEQGILVFNALPMEEKVWQGKPFPAGLFRDVCHVPGDLLNDGVHRVELLVVEDGANVVFKMDDALIFDVRDVIAERDGWYGDWVGVVRPRLPWTTDLLQEAE